MTKKWNKYTENWEDENGRPYTYRVTYPTNEGRRSVDFTDLDHAYERYQSLSRAYGKLANFFHVSPDGKEE